MTLLTVGVPTLFLTPWARPTRPDEQLLGKLARFVIPAALITAGFGTAVYAMLYKLVSKGFAAGRTPAQVISDFESYTGLAYGVDTDFAAAAATIAAQTGLSTFVCLASFMLILFLAPPTRFFAAWTRPTTDRRPAVLIAVLIAAFAGMIFVPVLSDYFGLTGPAIPVFTTVVPALVLWFAALSAAFRLRLLDRILRLDELPAAPKPRAR